MSSTTASVQQSCPHCGGIHLGVCSRIKSIDYYPDGTIKHIEYHATIDSFHLPRTNIEWRTTSEPGAHIEVKTGKIPDAIQKKIAAALEGK